MKKLINFTLVLVLSVFASCTFRPKEVLDEGKMKNILVEVYKLDGVFYQKGVFFVSDSNKVLYYDKLLANSGVTRAQFDTSLVWYNKHPLIFEKIYDQVILDLTTYKNNVYSGKLHPFDSTLNLLSKENLWTKSRQYRFTKKSRKTQFKFIVSNPHLMYGDVILFIFNQSIAPSDSCIEPYAVLNINYKDGVTDSIKQALFHDGKVRKYKFRITATRPVAIETLSGKLIGSQSYKGAMNVRIDSIALVRLYNLQAMDSLNGKVVESKKSFFQKIFSIKKDSQLINQSKIAK
jgi:small nuclear ribonucleoprotein (snRNP)-like protein